jgi:hypothetical protein
MSNDHTLVLSTVTATIHAPIEKVDIADWLFNLPDAEYQRCSPAHIAAAPDEFLAFLEKNSITFEQARAANQALTDSHNREETPNFAKSIERRALLR